MKIHNTLQTPHAQTPDKSGLLSKETGSTKLLATIGALLGFMGAGSATLLAGDANIYPNSVKQVIRGFGGASIAQNGNQPSYSDADADNLFGNGWSGQMGLSINRVEITAGGTATNGGWSTHRAIAQKAQARGAITIASPWSPPASMKTNHSTVQGSLVTSQYDDYAAWLKSFDSYMAAGGVDLYAISMQNEPDINVNYNSCHWTAAQIQTFMQNNAQNIGTRVIMPETSNYDKTYSDPTLDNATSASHTSIVGTHLYGATIEPYANATGKEIWMTEHYFQDNGTYKPRCYRFTDALTLAKEINDCMTIGHMNAYVWWWMKDDYIGLINEAGAVTQYGYAMGHFAKFVHPGYYHVDANINPTPGIYVSAFKDGTHLTIVAINNGTSAVSQKFIVQGLTVTAMTRYCSTATNSMKLIGNTGFSNSTTTITLPAQSITTLYN